MSRAGTLYELDLNTVRPDPDQPRKYLDPQALEELASSIRSHGVLQPILVREENEGRFVIVSGERRFQAARLAGLATIPALVTAGEPAEIAIIENLLRENLTAIEEAEAIELLRGVHDYSLAELAQALGKSDSAISEILSLNRLPAEVKDDCRSDPRVSRRILAVITRQKTPEKMAALYLKYKESGLTRGEIIKQTAPKAIRKPLSADDVAGWAERLDTLVIDGLTAEQKTAIRLAVDRLRSVGYQKVKLLKV
jgi:ParB family chromosome partitioning protein